MADKKSFKNTLNLPTTDFPIRPNAKENDPKMLDRWAKEGLSKKTFEHNQGKEKFILHDGPPYANGHTHIGHAYNKILKDIVAKSQRMFGKQVPVTPGWDCHGLPIELKVSQENPGVKPIALKKECRAYAKKWIDIQREEFKKLGVMMDWDNPYLTMNPKYESNILRAFGEFVGQGYIERKNKTVPWCFSCKTVLASAEIEYQERKDPSIYVLFPLVQSFIDSNFTSLQGKEVSLLVWTTTPWTLPLNRAVMIKPNAEYVILDIDGKYVVIGKALADTLCQNMDIEKKVILEFNSNDLVLNGKAVQHPFIAGLTVPLIADDSVLLDEGTAFVHSAPGAGPIDYEIGVRNNLEIYSPVGPDGKYTNEVEPAELAGMSVTDGQIWVIKKLASLGKLLFKKSIRHSYPHCWRCRNGLIFRATKQWFCDLSKNNLREKALAEVDVIHMLPKTASNRFKATIETRLEWCLSRQRVWGVPIPALICQNCDYTYTSKELIFKVAQGVEAEGIEYWDSISVANLIDEQVTCKNCEKPSFKKEQDILDVWFDSGVSHYAVLRQRPALAFPADMYLEGKDQHRGWFQSSLLSSMIINGTTCTKNIVTHGFTVDDKGRKMSKSLGNVVSPGEMIDKLGTDGLRLWASSIDISGEAVVSDALLKNIQEVYRKVRNTMRFLLSNLYDFDIKKDALPIHELRVIDQYALQQLFEHYYNILESYAEYDFTAVAHKLGDYCSSGLSSFYLDIVKDRLYVEKADGKERRSAQTVCWYILDTLTKAMAPVLSFTAERISDHYQTDKKVSIHLQQFSDLIPIWEFLGEKYASVKSVLDTMSNDKGNIFKAMKIAQKLNYVAEQEQRWNALKQVRSGIMKAIEELREQQIVKHSLEAKIIMYIDDAAPIAPILHKFFKEFDGIEENVEDFLKEFLIVSQCDVVTNAIDMKETIVSGLFVKAEHADGEKCPRCWQWSVTDQPDKLCKRCESIVK